MDIWSRYEEQILKYMEARVSDLLAQSGGTNSPWVVSEVRQAAAWAGEEAIRKFKAKNPKRTGHQDA
jgi:hypothetical protein